MRMFSLVAAAGVAVCTSALAASVIEVPLKYSRDERPKVEFFISSIKVANFDMLAPGAKPPVFEIDLRTSDIVKNLIPVSTAGTTATTVGGKECHKGRYVSFTVDDPTSACSKGDLYALIEYFDNGLPDSKIGLSYDSKKDDKYNFHTETDPIPIANTNQWKRHQFHLPNAFFGNRAGGIADFSILATTKRDFFPSGSQYPTKLESLPVGRWKLPRAAQQPVTVTDDGWTVVSEMSVPRKPFFVLLKLGDKEHLCMVDFQNADSKFYDCVYFDANGNGDLTDDQILTGTVSLPSRGGSSYSTSFDPIDTKVDLDGNQLPYSFSIYMYGWRRQEGRNSSFDFDNLRFSIRANCCYRGEFEAGGKKWQVVLGDTNANGRFDDVLTGTQSSYIMVGGTTRRYLRGDGFYVRSTEPPEDSDSQVLGKQLLLGSDFFDVKVSTAENKLSLSPPSAQLAAVGLPTPTRRLELYTEDMKRAVMIVDPPGKEIRVPEGQYCIQRYTLTRNDDQGDLWRLSANGSDDPTTVALDAQTPNRLAYGEPYKVSVNMPNYMYQQMSSGSPQVRLELRIEGMGGDLVNDVTHVTGTLTKIPLSEKSPDRPKEPTYKIATADGEIVADGNFEYG